MNKVTLVHSTPDGDELIAYMARVSNPTNQANPNAPHVNILKKYYGDDWVLKDQNLPPH